MSTIEQNVTRREKWAVRMLTVLVILAFGPGVMKLIQHPTAIEGFARVEIPKGAIVPIGIVEMSCLALYLIPRTTILGILLLTGYLGGAVMVNIIGRSDFIHALGVGLIV